MHKITGILCNIWKHLFQI